MERLTAKTTKFNGWLIDDLKEAFDSVVNPDNWKLKIISSILVAKIDIVNAAIVFYAGGEAKFSAPFYTSEGFKVTVSAPGYYELIGA